MTKREMFAAIANVAEVSANAEMVEFLNHQIELLDARKSGKGLTKTQKANEEVKAVIAEVLADVEKATVTDLIKDERLGGFTNQKVSALLRQMKDKGLVDKTMEGKKAYFSLV